jgi:F0F1-type ATP synthase membrane subunit b/b'
MSNSTDAVLLWGCEFRRNKNGLDEDQVIAFVNGLTAERDLLKKYQDHLLSLTKLAEKTVEQADEIARQARKEALTQAQIEADAINAQAQEQGRQIIEGKKAEAVVQATAAAEAIKADARKQTDLVLNEETRKVRTELKGMVDRLYRDLGIQLGSLMQQIDRSGGGNGNRLSLIAEPATAPPLKSHKTESEPAEPTMDPVEFITEWEIKVPPPLDIMQTLQIITLLDGLPEVRCTELIPQGDEALMMVYLKKPLQVVDVLKAMPQVADAREEDTNENSNGQKVHRVMVTLAGKVGAQPDDQG